MDQIRIKAEARAEQGTAAVRRLRRAGMIPGSVMKMNKGGTELIKCPGHEFMMAMRGRTGKQLLVTLDMGGREVPALLRELQNDVLGQSGCRGADTAGSRQEHVIVVAAVLNVADLEDGPVNIAIETVA